MCEQNIINVILYLIIGYNIIYPPALLLCDWEFPTIYLGISLVWDILPLSNLSFPEKHFHKFIKVD